MKKITALILAVMIFCITCAVMAEEAKPVPMYATIGEALEAAGTEICAGGEGAYYAVVTEKDGKYYRHVATLDAKLEELQNAVYEIDLSTDEGFDLFDKAMSAADEYMKTIPIDYTEEFTAVPMVQEELDALVGKTLTELWDAGYEGEGSGMGSDAEDGSSVIYWVGKGVFKYACGMDADEDAYFAAQENGTEGDLIVKSVKFDGIASYAYEPRCHADGTVDEPEDPFAEFSALMEEIAQVIEQNTDAEGNVDFETVVAFLKGKYPDKAEEIDNALMMFKMFGSLSEQPAE